MTSVQTDRSDGWGRVLETTDLTGGVPFPYQMLTALKYYKSDQGQHDGRLQYDLDDTVAFPGGGDGKITMDHGYINIRPRNPNTPEPGVRVVTRKVVRIEGFPPVLQKIWICALGYGYAAMEMIFGGAQDAPKGATGGTDPPRPAEQHCGSAGHAGARMPHAGRAPRRLPNGGRSRSPWCRLPGGRRQAERGVGEKWAKGKLQISDLVKFSSEVGARMASDAWRFLEKLGQLPPPKNPPAGDP